MLRSVIEFATLFAPQIQNLQNEISPLEHNKSTHTHTENMESKVNHTMYIKSKI